MKYSLSPREIPWGKPEEFPEGSGYIFIIFPHFSHNTEIVNYKSSIDFPGRSVMEELILRIALTAGQY